VSLWDTRRPDEAVLHKHVDHATGQLFPLFDEGTGLVLLTGRGDNTIRIFDTGVDRCEVMHCNDMQVA
jgi:hypothetical protein